MMNQIIEIISIGIPFCAFKIISGIHFSQTWLIGLGLIDAIINLINLFSLIFLKKRLFDACLLSFVVRSIKKPKNEIQYKWQDLGNSIDVLLSFTLVAYMIGAGHIVNIKEPLITIWNLSVVFNVFGAGYSRMFDSIKNLKT